MWEYFDYCVFGDFYDFFGDVYLVGWFDKDSEGLFIIINDKVLIYWLFDLKFEYFCIYWVQVEGILDCEVLF